MKEYLIGDKPITLYTTGDMARIVKRTRRTLYLWEEKGILPKARYKNQGVRLYTLDQINTVRLFKRYNKMKRGRQLPPGKKIEFSTFIPSST